MRFAVSVKEDYTPSNARLTIMMVVLGLGYFFCYFHRTSLSVLASDIVKDFGLDAAALGILGSAYYYPYAVMQIPCGIIVDRIGAKITISTCLLIAAVGSFWFAMTDSFGNLVIARGLIGFAMAFAYVPALRAIREWFKAERFGFLTGVLFTLGTLGALFASAPLTFIAKHQGWRLVFYEIGILMLALGLIAWFAVLGHRKKPAKPAMDSLPKALPGHKHSARTRIIWFLKLLILCLWFFCFSGTKLSFQTLWAGPYLASVFSFSKENVGYAMMFFHLGNVCSGPIVGFLADRLDYRKILMATTGLVALLWLIMANWTGSMSLQLASILYFTMGFFGGGALIGAFTASGLYAKKEFSGSVLGITNTIALLGSAVFTQGTGYTIKALASHGPAGSYRILYWIFFALVAMCTLLAYFMKKHFPERGRSTP